MWRLSDQKLHHIVELPERVKSIRQLVSLAQIFDEENNTIFGVLSQDGVLRFISLNTYKIVFSVGGIAGVIEQAAVSPNSKHIAIVMDNGSWQVSLETGSWCFSLCDRYQCWVPSTLNLLVSSFFRKRLK